MAWQLRFSPLLGLLYGLYALYSGDKWFTGSKKISVLAHPHVLFSQKCVLSLTD